ASRACPQPKARASLRISSSKPASTARCSIADRARRPCASLIDMVSGKAWWVALGAAVLVGVAFACSSSDDPGSPFDNDAGRDANGDGAPIDGLTSIDIAPGDVKLVAGDTNQSQAFTATGHFVDGSTKDITAQVTWKGAPDTIISANGPTVV